MPSRRLWVKRRRTPRGAILLSWIVAAVVWLWIFYRFIVHDLPETSSLFDANGIIVFLNGLFFVVVATVVAAFAMFLVRIIGRAWLNLRS